MIKSILHPSGRKLFFGRKRPVAHYPRLSLKNYLARAILNPPSSWNWRRLAVPSLLQMYLNDSLGDCVIAELAHSAGVLTANATGIPIIFTDNEITSLYSAIGGYVPGDSSTDNGCDIQTALNYWGVNGLLSDASHKIQGYLAINPLDITEIQLALFLFSNLCFGVELPDSWISPFPFSNSFTWDVSGPPNPNNGHCFLGYGYDSSGVDISTWALEGKITYKAIAQYCASSANGELYTVISQDGINRATSRAPNGFDWTQLLADFDAIKS
jgi:hypothetical protein